MISRKEKVEELLVDLQSLRRSMAFRMSGSAQIPRITPSQWGLLMLIEQQGKSTVKDVAKALGISSSAATQLVDGLVSSGYVERKTDTQDRRAVILTLSKKTMQHVALMKRHALQRFLKAFTVLSDKEFNQYCLLNKKIVRGVLKRHA